LSLTEGNFIYKTEKAPANRRDGGKDGGDDGPRAVITGLLQERRHVEVPEMLGGFPVTAIAPHALAEKA
jgi:hypothetical protein